MRAFGSRGAHRKTSAAIPAQNSRGQQFMHLIRNRTTYSRAHTHTYIHIFLNMLMLVVRACLRHTLCDKQAVAVFVGQYFHSKIAIPRRRLLLPCTDISHPPLGALLSVFTDCVRRFLGVCATTMSAILLAPSLDPRF